MCHHVGLSKVPAAQIHAIRCKCSEPCTTQVPSGLHTGLRIPLIHTLDPCGNTFKWPKRPPVRCHQSRWFVCTFGSKPVSPTVRSKYSNRCPLSRWYHTAVFEIAIQRDQRGDTLYFNRKRMSGQYSDRLSSNRIRKTSQLDSDFDLFLLSPFVNLPSLTLRVLR